MSDVPPEVLVGILSRLPVKSLLRFRSVCKPFCALIDSPYLVNLNLQQSMKTDKILAVFGGDCSSASFCSFYMDSPPIVVELEPPFDRTDFPYVLGSCHGLICLSSGPYDRLILLWNPSTRKCKLIPPPIHDSPPAYGDIITIDQVGYDHVNNDYKVVRLAQSSGPEVFFKVSVFSLKLNAWQSEEQDFPYNFFVVPCKVQGVCVSGAVHWLLNKNPGPDTDCLIVGFDLASQRFESVPQPECFNSYLALDLGILGGCFCVVGNGEIPIVDVWVMGEYGVKESWSKLVALTTENCVMSVLPYAKPIIYLNNGKEVLLEMNQWFAIYDLQEKKCTQIWFCDASHMSTFVYHESLV